MKIQYKYMALFAWMLLIFLLSNEVASTSSGRSNEIVRYLTTSFHFDFPQEFLIFITRKAAHIIAYFILGILAFNVASTHKFEHRRAILLSIIFAFAYAISDELHQLFVPGRSGEIRDILIDTTAAALGIYLYYCIINKRQNSIKSKYNV